MAAPAQRLAKQRASSMQEPMTSAGAVVRQPVPPPRALGPHSLLIV
jgi:hypothetical protein